MYTKRLTEKLLTSVQKSSSLVMEFFMSFTYQLQPCYLSIQGAPFMSTEKAETVELVVYSLDVKGRLVVYLNDKVSLMFIKR